VHSSRLSHIARKPVSGGVIALALVSVTTQMVALAAVTGWSATRSGDIKSTMAAAVVQSLECGGSAAKRPAACASAVAQPKLEGATQRQRVLVPTGGTQCPDSGPGVSCANLSVDPDTGNSAVPAGLPACPVDPTKTITAHGSCQPAAPAVAVPPAPPVSASPAGGPQHSPDVPTPELALTSSSSALNAGDSVQLTATSTLDVTGTPYAIEIFDVTTQSLVAACAQADQCVVSFSAKSGTHQFIAFVTAPTTALPTSGVRLRSNEVDVSFLGVSLQVDSPAIVAPGSPVTFVADATQDVATTGFVIELHDATTGERLTYCSRGTTCSMSLVEPTGGMHRVVADLSPATPQVLAANPDVHPASSAVSATWLAVHADARVRRGVVTLSALANADLSQTPYSIYFFDQSGKQQIGDACNAMSCGASAPAAAPGENASYMAVIASVPNAGAGKSPASSVLHGIPISLDTLAVEATSGPVTPLHVLWGVDSCKGLTDDGVLPQVKKMLGTPDFWGRYLPNTGNCGGLSPAEIAAAHSRHMGILPIYNDYDCSAVSGNATGQAYANAAIGLLQGDAIPQGTVIAIDIEPEGPDCPGAANVDTGFIQGWYDVLVNAGYVPAYYGNTTPGSAFANAWCATTQQRPDIPANSYLWSFEPSLSSHYTEGNMPPFNPAWSNCPGRYAAWQFQLSPGQDGDVDQDEVISSLPLWYP